MSSKTKVQKTPISSNEKRKEKVPKGLDPYLEQFATQVLVPASCSGQRLVVGPSSYPQQVCVRHIHKVFDVASSDPAYATGFTVVMSPNPNLPGFISGSAAMTVPVGGVGNVGMMGDITSGPPGLAQNMEGVFSVSDTTGRRGLLRPVQILDTLGVSYSGFSLTPSPAAEYSIRIRRLGNAEDACSFSMYTKPIAGNWGIATNWALSGHSPQELRGTIPLNTNAMAFASNKEGMRFRVNIDFLSEQVVTAAVDTFTPAFADFIADRKVKFGALRSMSVLATNTSPDLADGGNINIGRVPNGFNPFGSVTGAMADLPDNRRYQGPAKLGGYCTWIPSQVDEYEVANVGDMAEALNGAEYIVCQVQGWAPPVGSVASFRLQFDWIFEFYTPNQLFEKEFTPMRTPEFDALYHLLLSMPAATCNPKHTSLLKDLVRRGTSAAKGGYDFYKRNQTIIDALGKILFASLT